MREACLANFCSAAVIELDSCERQGVDQGSDVINGMCQAPFVDIDDRDHSDLQKQ